MNLNSILSHRHSDRHQFWAESGSWWLLSICFLFVPSEWFHLLWQQCQLDWHNESLMFYLRQFESCIFFATATKSGLYHRWFLKFFHNAVNPSSIFSSASFQVSDDAYAFAAHWLVWDVHLRLYQSLLLLSRLTVIHFTNSGELSKNVQDDKWNWLWTWSVARVPRR